MPRQKRPDGQLYGVIGAARSGKSTFVQQQVADVPRLLLWDYKGEYHQYGCQRVDNLEDLVWRSAPGFRTKDERIALHMAGMSDRRVFALFCRIAFIWLRSAIGTVVFEETSSVTSPSKAPTAYGDVLRMGLGFGADIFAITQRPQESDKTAYGNATVLHVHQLATLADCRYVARNFLPVEVDELVALKPLQWIERRNTGELTRGTIELRKPARQSRK